MSIFFPSNVEGDFALTIKNSTDDYKELSDEELVRLTKEKNQMAIEELILRYQNFVKSKCRIYFLIGADKEDIFQEGMIGLFKAIRDYDQNKHSNFRLFAEMCITRQVITAIKAASRQKHIPLNTYISLNKPIYDDNDDRILIDTIASTIVSDPEELIINKEQVETMMNIITGALSSFEHDVLKLYLDGMSYHEIAEYLNKDIKSVDNALQRVKRKIEKYILKEE